MSRLRRARSRRLSSDSIKRSWDRKRATNAALERQSVTNDAFPAATHSETAEVNGSAATAVAPPTPTRGSAETATLADPRRTLAPRRNKGGASASFTEDRERRKENEKQNTNKPDPAVRRNTCPAHPAPSRMGHLQRIVRFQRCLASGQRVKDKQTRTADWRQCMAVEQTRFTGRARVPASAGTGPPTETQREPCPPPSRHRTAWYGRRRRRTALARSERGTRYWRDLSAVQGTGAICEQ